jgi:hypothetical protein
MLSLLKEIRFGAPSDLVFKTNAKGIETTEVNRRNYFSAKFKEVKAALENSTQFIISDISSSQSYSGN